MAQRRSVRSQPAFAAAAVALVAIGAWRAADAQPSAPPASGASSRVVATRALPPLDGSRLEATLVEVTYPPGATSSPHSHPCAVIGYVVSGAVRMQVKGEAEAVYHAGQTFYEAPNGVHQVSANASATEPATFIASFTCDRRTALTVPAPH